MDAERRATATMGGRVLGGGWRFWKWEFEKLGRVWYGEHSQQTDTSTDVDTERKFSLGFQHGSVLVVISMEQSKGGPGGAKAYVQQLETSRLPGYNN
nr:transcription factor TGA2.2-like [Ipomoea batatas]